MQQNRQELASVNESLTSWVEPKRLVNKLVDNLWMTPQTVLSLTTSSFCHCNMLHTLPFKLWKWYKQKQQVPSILIAWHVSSWPCSLWKYCLQLYSQVVNKLVNKSFWLNPAGQCLHLPVPGDSVAQNFYERLTRPFSPTQTQKKKKWSGHARLRLAVHALWPQYEIWWLHSWHSNSYTIPYLKC